MVSENECFFRKEDGSLWVATSHVNEEGETVTQSYQVEPAPEPSGS